MMSPSKMVTLVSEKVWLQWDELDSPLYSVTGSDRHLKRKKTEKEERDNCDNASSFKYTKCTKMENQEEDAVGESKGV